MHTAFTARTAAGGQNARANTIIIGAGPAGLTAAHELAKHGGAAGITVLEAAAAVGGMARTIPLWGQRVDLGPHRFFSSDTRVNKLWLEIAGRDYDMVPRLTRILYRGRLFHYPLKPFNALRNLGLFEAARCMASYFRGKMRAPGGADSAAAGAGASFEQWVSARFGRRLFGIFFKTYSEKLWGIRCDQIDADFAAQRIKKFSLGEAVKAALFNSGGKHKTLVDVFAYPHGGSGAIYERMAARIAAAGGVLRLGTPVRRVLTTPAGGGRGAVIPGRDGAGGDARASADRAAPAAPAARVAGVELASGEIIAAGRVVSTMPVTDLVAGLDAVPAAVRDALAALRFRNTVLVFLKIDAENLFPDNWLYVHAADLRCGRITNFRNWSPTLNAGGRASILALEYWCHDEDAFWGADDAGLVALASDEIRRSGLLPAGAVVAAGHVERLRRSYPVYARGYRRPLSVVENHLRGIEGLTVIGRYGAFKYNNQDHSILMGLLAAENIAGGAAHDLWAVNTDYEYQEASVITATGLQPR
jgi:protoporphyrinogen oxidase